MCKVLGASPSPPLALLFSGTVLTNAARRHQRSFDRAQRSISESGILATSPRWSRQVTSKSVNCGPAVNAFA